MSDPVRTDAPRPARVSYAEYAALPDDGRRYQLVEGELVVMASPSRWHQLVVGELYFALRVHVEREGLGRVYVAPLDVVPDEWNALQPDVLFVSNERAAIEQDAFIGGAPDVCVEVLSPSTKHLDRVRKLEIYARFGVPHYWIVDLSARTIEEYVLAGDVYRVNSVTRYHEDFRPRALPGFSFRLEALGLPAED